MSSSWYTEVLKEEDLCSTGTTLGAKGASHGNGTASSIEKHVSQCHPLNALHGTKPFRRLSFMHLTQHAHSSQTRAGTNLTGPRMSRVRPDTWGDLCRTIGVKPHPWGGLCLALRLLVTWESTLDMCNKSPASVEPTLGAKVWAVSPYIVLPDGSCHIIMVPLLHLQHIQHMKNLGPLRMASAWPRLLFFHFHLCCMNCRNWLITAVAAAREAREEMEFQQRLFDEAGDFASFDNYTDLENRDTGSHHWTEAGTRPTRTNITCPPDHTDNICLDYLSPGAIKPLSRTC
eukprot:5788389-Amphidinium_carterae.2